jgi:hydroxypyruvate reductase
MEAWRDAIMMRTARFRDERSAAPLSPAWNRPRSDCAAIHRAALAAADPSAAVRRSIALAPGGLEVCGERVALGGKAKLYLVAAGKAAAAMTAGALDALGDLPAAGVVVTPGPAGGDVAWPEFIQPLSAAHPLPDASSLAAGSSVRSLLARTRIGDLVLVLISGGASSLLESLRPGISLESLREATLRLQLAGADVRQLNIVRRAASRLKGGGLARLAAPARVVTLAISDVIGDSPETIGSGPTVRSATGPAEALAVLRQAGVAADLPELVAVLNRLAESDDRREPLPGLFRIVGSNRDAAEAALSAAERLGFQARIVTLELQGEAREAGQFVGRLACEISRRNAPFAPPGCLIFGGETTVSVRGDGRGGRNQELVLGAAMAIAGTPRTVVFSFATDGIDGRSSAAGAIATSDTLARATLLGLSPASALARSDSESFFRALGNLWETGPTGTNVNDLTIALAYP